MVLGKALKPRVEALPCAIDLGPMSACEAAGLGNSLSQNSNKGLELGAIASVLPFGWSRRGIGRNSCCGCCNSGRFG